MEINVFPTAPDAVRAVAGECEALVVARGGSGPVLGLATGATPVLLYRELVRRHAEGGLSFAGVRSFNLDEYLGLGPDHPQSYRRFMQENLFDHIDIREDCAHVPPGLLAPDEVGPACAGYEEAILRAGGIDFQILGIGRTGHIGFNEPGSPRDSRTRLVHLDELTRRDAAASFGGLTNVPTHAITMGCGTILEARRIVLMAWGAGKADILREAIEGPVTDRVSASFLQDHPNAAFFLDEAAASRLSVPVLRPSQGPQG
jgi:glucosamine-6-phosphate deaminase